MKQLKVEHLPGMKPPSIAEIDEAMEVYVDKRDSRMEMLQSELEAKAHLQVVMEKHGQKNYRNTEGDRTCIIEAGEPTLKVKKEKEVKMDKGD